MVSADEIVLLLVDGPSADAVRPTVERSGLPCHRVIESIRLPTVGIPDRA